MDDVIDALLLTATSDDAIGRAYNLGSPAPISLEETASIMCAQVKGSSYELVPFPENRKAIDVGDFVCDYSSFSKALNWEPKTSFEEGISRSLDFFKGELEYYL